MQKKFTPSTHYAQSLSGVAQWNFNTINQTKVPTFTPSLIKIRPIVSEIQAVKAGLTDTHTQFVGVYSLQTVTLRSINVHLRHFVIILFESFQTLVSEIYRIKEILGEYAWKFLTSIYHLVNFFCNSLKHSKIDVWVGFRGMPH